MRAFVLMSALVVGIVAVHLSLLDGLPGWTLATFYQDDTQYAARYSVRAFRAVRPGMTQKEVFELLGPPLGVSWVFEGSVPEQVVVTLDGDDKVEYVYPRDNPLRIEVGTESEALRERVGVPDLEIYAYSRSPHDSSYRVRVVHVASGHVIRKIHEYYLD